MSDGVKHLLYLLPDVAYAVELVAGKDNGGWTVRDYLQVNGEFMDENVILPTSMEKLVGKLQPHQYELVLPDFLFTNTVVNVNQTGDEAVKKYIQSELIPNLELSEESHDIKAFVLTEFKGASKVQLSALEKSLLDPVKQAFGGDGQASLGQVYPLSWTLKSLISLEPSISVVQLGGHLYLAQHYIGVDQANDAEAQDAEKLVETVKTLKGAEPNIQTLYLLSSALVEQKLKDGLKATLPIQQLASDNEEAELPSYIKQVVEASAKTLSVADYKIPVFSVEGVDLSSAPAKAAFKQKENMKKSEPTKLPEPTEVGGDEPELVFADNTPAEEELTESSETSTEVESKPVDLRQFAVHEDLEETEEAEEAEEMTEPEPEAKPVVKSKPAMKSAKVTEPEPMTKKPVIKNDRGVNSMVRMIFIGLASFFITVGIGLGIGLGLLTFTKSGETPSAPAPTETAMPTTQPTATPTPAQQINRTDYDVLVVNATTRAGYAGEIATKLETAGFENVDSGNASGDYEPGSYVLMAEENPALVTLLSEDTDLTLTAAADSKTVEDASNQYDIVVVLAE